ncbi:MAG: sigma-70 family RNA polymerase sigma factor [Bacteroidetes bacterium]|nr:sigma-70 family RNA polymerase sigma factor [Bacteroidota bacterium]
MENKADIFLEYKTLLFSIAYNMLGKIDEAEEIVQDTFLKWMDVEIATVKQEKAFLVKMTTNACINHLTSTRVKREKYIGIWLPEPLQNYAPDHTQTRFESYHALSIGMLVLMEKLTPQERAIFLLKEIFAYDYYELADLFNKTTDSCRQILKRAKDHLGQDTRRFEVDLKVHEKVLQNFLQAIAEGNMTDLIDLLKQDIHLYADGGGQTITIQDRRFGGAFPKPIMGRDNVTRLLLNIIPKFRQQVPDFSEDLTIANGMPSIITYSGKIPISLVAFETDGEQIRNIYVQTNPDKLKYFKK